MGAIVGIVLCLAAILIAVILEGGSPMAFANLPAAVIIFGGTFGAAIASFSLPDFLRLPKLIKVAIGKDPGHDPEVKATFVRFAERARRDGLLALEAEVDAVHDPFQRRGLQMVIDGVEPETVEEVLELEIEATQHRHARGVAMLTAMGGYAPTMGIIGTVMGLVNVLSRLDDPGELGHAIAVAFIATLIGVMTANVFWLPLASNLREKDKKETEERRMALVAILAIQAGDNPRIVARKLESFGDARTRKAAEAAAAQPATASPAAEGAA